MVPLSGAYTPGAAGQVTVGRGQHRRIGRMAIQEDAVNLLGKLLEQGSGLYERLHRSSVERRKPSTLVERQVQPPPDSATPEEMDG